MHKSLVIFLLAACAADAQADVMLVANPKAGEIDVIAPGGALTPFATGFTNPLGVATGTDNTVFVETSRSVMGGVSNLITRISPSGQKSAVVVGEGGMGMAVDSQGDLFVSSTPSQLLGAGAAPQTGVPAPQTPAAPYGLSKITPDGTLHAILPLTAQHPSMWALATDNHDNVYVGFPDEIDKVTPAGDVSVFKTFFGDPVFNLNGYPPLALAVDHSGNVYATNFSLVVLKITPQGVATSLGPGYGLGVDSQGDIFNANNSISQINLDGTTNAYAVTNFAQSIAFLVPEPSSLMLAAFGFVALAALGWRRWKPA
jgi:hypothetical protein